MSKKANDPDRPIWDGLGGLDKLLEHRVRLGICVLLSQNDELSFQRLKSLLGETDGSLGAHLKKLEEAAYLKVKKEFRDRKPVTWYHLTDKGGTAIRAHLDSLQELVRRGKTTG